MVLEDEHGMNLDLIAAKLNLEVYCKEGIDFIWVPKSKFTSDQIIAAMGNLIYSFKIKENKKGFFII